MSLNDFRKKIDVIDASILDLLTKRAKEVIKVNKLKKNKNIKVYAPQREANILRTLKKKNKSEFKNEDIEMIFSDILSVCRSLTGTIKIAYLGPEGTFTHLAAIKKFGKKAECIPSDSIGDVFDKVERGEVNYGVVPIENSIEGVVNYTLDMFFVSDLKVCAEATLGISHYLLSKSKQKIRRIYSHPQVFPQCRKWLSRNYPDVELIPVLSTAKAAVSAKADANGACIGNKILAGIYGLKIIASSIEEFSSNMTRFLVISDEDSLVSGKDKTSILFAMKDRVGALYDVLYAFKRHNVNLTKIESRPSKKKLWEYYFFVDFQGHRNEAVFKKLLEDLEKSCSFIKVLGSYPKES